MSIFKFNSFIGCFSSKDASQNNNVSKKDSVYIQDINGKLWKTEDWDGSVKPNAIVVVADEAKFLIALTQPSSEKSICNVYDAPLEKYMRRTANITEAKADYDGAGNTERIIMVEASSAFAAGYCDDFIFPDGKTRGYLPSFGQLNIAYRNKIAIAFALRKCGGDAMVTGPYWSSTFHRVISYYGINLKARTCWTVNWCGYSGHPHVDNDCQVRPFADFQ